MDHNVRCAKAAQEMLQNTQVYGRDIEGYVVVWNWLETIVQGDVEIIEKDKKSPLQLRPADQIEK